MVTVVAVLGVLTAAGLGLLNGTGVQSRKAGVDLLAGMVEQARAAAITSRSHVVLAVVEHDDFPGGEPRCRLGLFRVECWPDPATAPLTGVLIGRWRALGTGVVLIGGEVDGMVNPMDGDILTLCHGTPGASPVKVRAIAFNAHGGLHYPAGSAPVAMRVAEGGYRRGKATPNRRGEAGVITETRLKIGRVNPRPYRIDG